MKAADFALDAAACSVVAVCLHCDARMVRAEAHLVRAEMRAHIAAAHPDAPGALSRVQHAERWNSR